MKKKKSEPVIIKALSFNEMIAEVQQKNIEAHTKFQKDGLCQAKDCTDKGAITSNGYLCNKHNKEIEDLVKELSKNSGFMRL